MDVSFKTRKLERILAKKEKILTTWGHQAGLKVMQRLKELEAAPNLFCLTKRKSLHFHLLKGDRSGTYAINVWRGLRMVFEPNHNPPPRLEDGSIDLSRVTCITILEVGNYHGKQKKNTN
ncbi:hypothetical protein [Thermovirga sp.]|uniref:hypothetical protein n=1 Tax=Thermovirga sp. TaxID=2699834 RepID=UPI0025E8DCA9|nr:hypothetical protein [Thermovirga sp.]MBO8154785.1 hypothetical protein [Thermovirga sp.]